MHYLRPVEGSAGFQALPHQASQQQVITLPITMPGAKPGIKLVFEKKLLIFFVFIYFCHQFYFDYIDFGSCHLPKFRNPLFIFVLNVFFFFLITSI